MLRDVRVWIFDCDGVLLDSNSAKTSAFRAVTLPYGEEVSNAFVEHHIENGGVSRFEKFDHLFTSILRRSPEAGEMDRLLREFARLSEQGLREAAVEEHTGALMTHIRARGSAVYVASGGQQDEVRDALSRHGIAELFDGIFGSPASKAAIVGELVRRHSRIPAAMVGDSALDVEVALAHGLQPILISQWSEHPDIGELASRQPSVIHFQNLGQLLEGLSGTS